MIHFEVPGRPVPAARMTRKSKWTNQQAQRYLAYKQQVGWCAREVIKEPLTCPVAVTINAYLFGGRFADVDNLAKALLDGCNGIAFEDDRQVVELHIFRNQGKPQRAEVVIREVND